MRNKKKNSTTTVAMSIKPGRMVTYNEDLPFIKYGDFLMRLSSDFDFFYNIGRLRTQTPKSSLIPYF